MKAYSDKHSRMTFKGVWIWLTDGEYYFFDNDMNKRVFNTLEQAKQALSE